LVSSHPRQSCAALADHGYEFPAGRRPRRAALPSTSKASSCTTWNSTRGQLLALPRHRDLDPAKGPDQRSRAVTMAVAADTLRPITILDVGCWAAAVARTSQRRLELALNHRLDELTYPLAQPDFDRVKPIVKKMDRRLRFRLQGRRRRASVGHGVVSNGAPTPELIWVSPSGDYAILNSNHIPDGTYRSFLSGLFGWHDEHFL
jgi:hypothetical protein